MEHLLSSGSAGGLPRVEESKATMPVGFCLSQSRVLSGLVISNSLIRARSDMCRADLPEFTSYTSALSTSPLCA